ncbi:hypothetical protein [Denitrobaculum tricleocarpae]|uniref:hypothetical protein n=1 Tax=Denitrobaculum tricleocarpae TaxID=2591009 RepID=UPI0015D13600|nr:hypothetical protein [Denitrobaculum tricleocarpae]
MREMKVTSHPCGSTRSSHGAVGGDDQIAGAAAMTLALASLGASGAVWQIQ